MKTKLLISLFILCFYTTIKSQIPTWQWAKGAGAIDTLKSYDSGYAIATDNNGNSYVTGKFNQIATFGNFLIQSSGLHDIFLCKYDKNGTCLWVKKAGSGAYNDIGQGVDIDKNGNIYITGTFQGIATFGTLFLYSSLQNGFLAKYDNSGNEIWVKQLTTASYLNLSTGNDIAVDDNGNSYVTGNGFVTKHDSSGNVIYNKIIPPGQLYPTDIDIDKYSNAFITGYFLKSPTIYGGQTYTPIGFTDAFILKVDVNGDPVWFNHYGTPLPQGGNAMLGVHAYGEGVSVDDEGNVYFTGKYGFYYTSATLSINIGSFTLTSPSNSSGSSPGIFTVKFDTNGNVTWAKQNLSGSGCGYSIINDKFKNTYVTGETYGSGTFSFDSNTIFNSTNGSVFIVKYDSLGNHVFSKISTGSSCLYGGSGISLDSLCGIYITGTSIFTLSFGIYSTAFLGGGGKDVFVAKINGGYGIECNVQTDITNDENFSNAINIYPNPTNNFLTLKLAEKISEAEIKIYNLLGELQTNKIIANETNTIDVSLFATGIYVIEIVNEGNVSRQKFVKN